MTIEGRIAVESLLKLRFSLFVDRAEAKSYPTHRFARRVGKTCDLGWVRALADAHSRG